MKLPTMPAPRAITIRDRIPDAGRSVTGSQARKKNSSSAIAIVGNPTQKAQSGFPVDLGG
jgi:hypothetical protein